MILPRWEGLLGCLSGAEHELVGGTLRLRGCDLGLACCWLALGFQSVIVCSILCLMVWGHDGPGVDGLHSGWAGRECGTPPGRPKLSQLPKPGGQAGVAVCSCLTYWEVRFLKCWVTRTCVCPVGYAFGISMGLSQILGIQRNRAYPKALFFHAPKGCYLVQSALHLGIQWAHFSEGGSHSTVESTVPCGRGRVEHSAPCHRRRSTWCWSPL